MGFILVLIITTLSIAGSAAFFSVYGLAQIFTGSFWPVVVMAGKLVAASFVYRYWRKITFALKAYLMMAILVLMIITSAGIFGFLSSAYQKDILPLAQMEQKIVLLEERNESLEALKLESIMLRQSLETQKASEIAAMPANYATKKKEVAERYRPEIARISDEIAAYTAQIRATLEEQQELQLSTLKQENEIGPIIFIAEAFGREVNDATKWLILIIIFAFDPLAVALTIGANIAILERRGRKHHTDVKVSVDTTEDGGQISSEQIKAALEEFENRPLSAAELAQKAMLEQMLRKQLVTDKVRKGT